MDVFQQHSNPQAFSRNQQSTKDSNEMNPNSPIELQTPIELKHHEALLLRAAAVRQSPSPQPSSTRLNQQLAPVTCLAHRTNQSSTRVTPTHSNSTNIANTTSGFSSPQTKLQNQNQNSQQQIEPNRTSKITALPDFSNSQTSQPRNSSTTSTHKPNERTTPIPTLELQQHPMRTAHQEPIRHGQPQLTT